jgi:FkbM family methyltransferase
MNLKTPYSILTHSPCCLGGLFKRFDPTLVKARTQLLLKNRFDPFVTKEGYKIENSQQLYCYWDFAWEAIVFRGGWPDKLGKNPVIIDVGANYGTFGWLCRKKWPNATIIGFEPIPDLAEFCKRLSCYDEIYPVALSDSAGTATLFLDFSLGLTATLGGNSLLNFTSSQIQVETNKLDSFNLHPDFMKVDVDGGELKTIIGGFKTFKNCPFTVIECTGKQRHKTVAELLQKQYKKLYFLGVDYLFHD